MLLVAKCVNPTELSEANRKQLYARRAKMEAEAPEGCFTSFSKYAAEASRIRSTDRMAF